MNSALIALILLGSVVSATLVPIVLIDAGSSGTRVYVYRYDSDSPLSSINEVARKRVHPGLSSFVDRSHELKQKIKDLIDFAISQIDVADISKTRISLKATAGMRGLSIEKQDAIMHVVKETLKHSPFLFDETETKVISGEEEALYDLFAVKTAFLGAFPGEVIGAADLGGASKQLSFVYSHFYGVDDYNLDSCHDIVKPSHALLNNGSIDEHVVANYVNNACEPDWILSPGQSESVQFDYVHRDMKPNPSSECQIEPQTEKYAYVYAKSVGGLGLISAMDTVITDYFIDLLESQNLVHDFEMDDGRFDLNIAVAKTIDDSNVLRFHPCLAQGITPYEYHDSFIHIPGAGDFDKCLKLINKSLIPNGVDEIDAICIEHTFPRTIIGIDNFAKVLEAIGIPPGTRVSPSEIANRGRMICQKQWHSILVDHPNYMPYRAWRACFGSAYIYSILTRIYFIDEDDAHTFMVYDSFGSFELSWALGAAVFSALNFEYKSL